jgi:hypothetical protein
MNRCAECGRALPWRDGAPVLWDGTCPFIFCSPPCRDQFQQRAHRPLYAA